MQHFVGRCAGLVGALVSILLLGPIFARAADTPPACDIAGAVVTSAYVGTDAKPTARASIRDVVTVKGDNLGKLFDKACAGREVVLYMNDWPLKDVKPLPPTNPASNTLKFKLITHHYEESSKNPWLPILGRPGLSPVKVDVSVGFADGFAIPVNKTASKAIQDQDEGDPVQLKLQVLSLWPMLFWGVVFIVMLAIFWSLAQYTNILRDPAPAIEGQSGPFSLSRTQGALWFFIIVAAYLFIGIVTGDFSDSINSTALILLGLGAGTLVGSTVIDAQKDTRQNQADTVNAIRRVRQQMNETVTQLGLAKRSLRDASPGSAGYDALKDREADFQAQYEQLKSQMRKLRGISENFLTDILSDANGVSFHRYQIAMWTVVLVVTFGFEVWQNLAMPVFNSTLMGLLGLSAATYLGLKIPEAVIPQRDTSAAAH